MKFERETSEQHHRISVELDRSVDRAVAVAVVALILVVGAALGLPTDVFHLARLLVG